jgi:hypothetical protein
MVTEAVMVETLEVTQAVIPEVIILEVTLVEIPEVIILEVTLLQHWPRVKMLLLKLLLLTSHEMAVMELV